jgi:hypothetical protein
MMGLLSPIPGLLSLGAKVGHAASFFGLQSKRNAEFMSLHGRSGRSPSKIAGNSAGRIPSSHAPQLCDIVIRPALFHSISGPSLTLKSATNKSFQKWKGSGAIRSPRPVWRGTSALWPAHQFASRRDHSPSSSKVRTTVGTPRHPGLARMRLSAISSSSALDFLSLVKRYSTPFHSAENHLFARRTANINQFQKRSNQAICKSLGFNIWNNRCVTKKLAV